jgi:hypothetical protein
MKLRLGRVLWAALVSFAACDDPNVERANDGGLGDFDAAHDARAPADDGDAALDGMVGGDANGPDLDAAYCAVPAYDRDARVGDAGEACFRPFSLQSLTSSDPRPGCACEASDEARDGYCIGGLSFGTPLPEIACRQGRWQYVSSGESARPCAATADASYTREQCEALGGAVGNAARWMPYCSEFSFLLGAIRDADASVPNPHCCQYLRATPGECIAAGFALRPRLEGSLAASCSGGGRVRALISRCDERPPEVCCDFGSQSSTLSE